MVEIRDFIYDYYGLTEEERNYTSCTRVPERIGWVRHVASHFMVKYCAPLKIDKKDVVRKGIQGVVHQKRKDTYSGFVSDVAKVTNRRSRQPVYNSLKCVDNAWETDIEFRKELTRVHKALMMFKYSL